MSRPSELLDHLGAQRRPDRAAAGPRPRGCQWARAALQRPADRLVDAQALVAGPAVVGEQRAAARSRRPRAGGRRSGAAGRWAAARSTITAVSPRTECSQPPSSPGVVHGRREADEADLGRGQDEHLLPDATAVGVLDEVHLVEDDGVQTLEQVGAGQEHVAQHLGGHDDDGRPGAQGRVAGEQPDVVLAVGGDQLAVLLVGQGLEGRRVEGLAPRRTARGGRRRRPRASCPNRSAPTRGPSARRRGPGTPRAGSRRGRRAGRLRIPPPRAAVPDGPRVRGQRPSSFPIPMEMK